MAAIKTGLMWLSMQSRMCVLLEFAMDEPSHTTPACATRSSPERRRVFAFIRPGNLDTLLMMMTATIDQLQPGVARIRIQPTSSTG